MRADHLDKLAGARALEDARAVSEEGRTQTAAADALCARGARARAAGRMARRADARAVCILANGRARREAGALARADLIEEGRRRHAREAIARARALTQRTARMAGGACVGRAAAAAGAGEAIFNLTAIALASVERDCIAIITRFVADALPIATDGGARVARVEVAASADEARLNLAGWAAAVAGHRVVVVTLLIVDPQDAPSVTAERRARVNSANASALRVRGAAVPSNLDAAERVAPIAANRIVVVANLG